MNNEKRKLKNSTLTNYFVKKSKKSDLESTDCVDQVAFVPDTNDSAAALVSGCESPSDSDVNINDISNFIGREQYNDEKRLLLLKNVWYPDDKFVFPLSGKRNLKFQYSWFGRWKWLLYSKRFDGAFCKFCVLFSANYGGVGHQPLGKLAKTAFSNWKDAIENFNKHQETEYHKKAVLHAQNRKAISEHRMEPVVLALDSALKKQIIENRSRLTPIIETILFCGRQGLALRGHRDSGTLTFDNPEENDGNFRALLRFRVHCGDEILKNHLEVSGKNATYLSPRIQNEIISACNIIVVRSIVAKINSAKSFSILADETSDIAGIEQFSLCFRYVDVDTYNIREDFLQFVPVTDVTGKGLANVVMQTMRNLEIDSKFMIGQGYDGASAMSGRFHGVQKYVSDENKLALYVHCASHSLNLAISDACEISFIRNCIGSLGSVYNFFNTPKRQTVLKNCIDEMAPESTATRLKQLCPTRWIQRHESVLVFLELQKAAISAMEIISDWDDKTTSSSAIQLLSVIRSTEFQVSLHVLAKVFAITLPLSRLLQTINLDLAAAIGLAENVEEVLDETRRETEKQFNTIFSDVKTICDELNVDIRIPRLTGRQVHRCNIAVENPEEYYRIAIFIPFLDSTKMQVHDRFLKHKNLLQSFMCLLPNEQNFSSEHENSAKILLEKYKSITNCSILEGIGELKLWWRHVLNSSDTPKNAHNAFLACDESIFPTVRKLLQIFATLPVTTSSSERSFSTLRRLKTYLRNTTSEDRLNGLALLNIHRNVEVSADAVLDELAKSSRKLEIRL